jgi:hypothetical protein
VVDEEEMPSLKRWDRGADEARAVSKPAEAQRRVSAAVEEVEEDAYADEEFEVRSQGRACLA